MLSQEEFLGLIKAAGSDFYPPDDEQAKAVYADPRADLFIVAGPGTGKTSCLSFRALYLIFVAGLTPRSIIATTFTKKAAAELRSRLLGWGYRLIDAATKTDLPQGKLEFLKAIDLNQILTGTIDSLAENILREHRAAGEEPPVLADDYITRTIMARDGLLDTKLYFSKSLNDLLGGWGATLCGRDDRAGSRLHSEQAARQQISRAGVRCKPADGRQRHVGTGVARRGLDRSRGCLLRLLAIRTTRGAALRGAGPLDSVQIDGLGLGETVLGGLVGDRLR